MYKHIRRLLVLLQHGKQIQQISPPQQQPIPKTPEEWSTYWKSQGQPWRTQPEIDTERQEELKRCLETEPEIEKGRYPFKNVKLSRADVEWLLATHEDGLGPVYWSNPNHQERSGLDLRGADLSDEDLQYLPLARLQGGLTRGDWRKATEEQRHMAAIHLERAILTYAHLEGSVLTHGHLQGAQLNETHLEGVDAFEAHFEAPIPANWHGVYFDASTKLYRATIVNDEHVGPRLFDVHWGGVHLTGIDWAPMDMIFEEYRAKKDEKMKTKQQRVTEYREAIHTYRQLCTELQSQGLNEEASKFAYRAHVLEKCVLQFQLTKQGIKLKQRILVLLSYLFSLLLDWLAGYGYRLKRTLGWYVAVNIFCAFFYFLGEPHGVYFVCPSSFEENFPHILVNCYWNWGTIFPTALDALATSITALHGRGLFSMPFGPGNWRIYLAAGEAVIGLFIEASFIATFIQRFFGK